MKAEFLQNIEIFIARMRQKNALISVDDSSVPSLGYMRHEVCSSASMTKDGLCSFESNGIEKKLLAYGPEVLVLLLAWRAAVQVDVMVNKQISIGSRRFWRTALKPDGVSGGKQ